jgi:hypothetical protein
MGLMTATDFGKPRRSLESKTPGAELQALEKPQQVQSPI